MQLHYTLSPASLNSNLRSFVKSSDIILGCYNVHMLLRMRLERLRGQCVDRVLVMLCSANKRTWKFVFWCTLCRTL